ncbi:MAG: class I SAM-dependent methyltransferase [Pseudomonadota bacterium]|nr:class I SAM-dependent methyltransferase [Pseudomonadota bacterium]
MGGGPFGAAAVGWGASAYLGVDPLVGTDHVRDFRSLADRRVAPYASFPFSCEEIMRLHPNVRLIGARVEDAVDEVRRFQADVAVLWGVTEHLRDPHLVVRTVWEALAPDGLIWLTHNNWYSWIGHHAAPRTLKGWNPIDPAQNAIVDWRHLDPEHPLNKDPNLNRMRMRDLRDLLDKYFNILEWSFEIDALCRLTPEIRNLHKRFPLEEMLATSVRVCGSRRAAPRELDLSDREFYHPSLHYMMDDDFSDEDIHPFGRVGYVHFGSRGQLVSHSDNDFAARRAIRLLKPGQRIGLRKGDFLLELTVDRLEYRQDGDVRAALREPISENLRTINRGMWVLIPGPDANPSASVDRPGEDIARASAVERRPFLAKGKGPAISLAALSKFLRQSAENGHDHTSH